MARLTEQEQQEIIRFIEADKPLPDKYRFLLFEDKREVELVWNGSDVDFHPEVTQVFHRELTRLKVMFCGLCWGQDMRGLPFRFGYC